MRRTRHIFFVWAIIFSTIAVKGYSQNILVSFKLTVTASVEQTAAPQSIDLDGLTQTLDSVIALVEVKDGKKHPIAAQAEKKGSHIHHLYVNKDQERMNGRTCDHSSKNK